VIQLWHYTEHTYFKGASVLAATAVAYREQLVWVRLLGCIHQLKVGGGRGVQEGGGSGKGEPGLGIHRAPSVTQLSQCMPAHTARLIGPGGGESRAGWLE
jgi:hypothetical protein